MKSDYAVLRGSIRVGGSIVYSIRMPVSSVNARSSFSRNCIMAFARASLLGSVGSSGGMAPFLLVLVVHKIPHFHLISIDSREGKVCRAWCTDILKRGFVEILRFPHHRRIGRFIGDSDDISDACLASLYQCKGNMLVFRYIAMQSYFTSRHGGKSTFWNPFKRNGKDTSVVRYRHLPFDHSSHSREFAGVFKEQGPPDTTRRGVISRLKRFLYFCYAKIGSLGEKIGSGRNEERNNAYHESSEAQSSYPIISFGSRRFTSFDSRHCLTFIRDPLRLFKQLVRTHRIRNPVSPYKPLNRFTVSNGCPVTVPQGFSV